MEGNWYMENCEIFLSAPSFSICSLLSLEDNDTGNHWTGLYSVWHSLARHFLLHSFYLPCPLYYTNKTLYSPILLIRLHTSVLLVFHIVHSSHMSQNYLFTIVPRTLLGTGAGSQNVGFE